MSILVLTNILSSFLFVIKCGFTFVNALSNPGNYNIIGSIFLFHHQFAYYEYNVYWPVVRTLKRNLKLFNRYYELFADRDLSKNAFTFQLLAQISPVVSETKSALTLEHQSQNVVCMYLHKIYEYTNCSRFIIR